MLIFGKDATMKKPTLLVLTMTIGLMLCGAPSAAQDGVQNADQARDLYLAHTDNRTKGRPGSMVKIELLRDGVKKFVPVSSEFRAGDKVKLHFAVNFDAYVAAGNIGSSGKPALLFPYEGASGRASRTQNYVIPHRPDLWFEFDHRPGTENITIILSSKPLTGGSTGKSGASDEKSLREISDGARDLNLVQVSSGEAYTVCDEPEVRRPVKFSVKLKHN